MTVSLSRTNRGETGFRSPTSVLANDAQPGDRTDCGRVNHRTDGDGGSYGFETDDFP